MRKVAILQSNYLPWRGYFEIIKGVDCFVFLDEVQYTKNDWRNRNRVKTPQGTVWLTVPIVTHGKLHQRICEARIKPGTQWARKHWRTIAQNYRKTAHFAEFRDPIEAALLGQPWIFLSELNIALIRQVCSVLGIGTDLVDSRDLTIELSPMEDQRTERIVQICRALNATHYLSGPAAKEYLDQELLSRAGITLEFMDYSGYPEYPQQFPPFDGQLSIIDLLFNCGSKSAHYIWGWRHQY